MFSRIACIRGCIVAQSWRRTRRTQPISRCVTDRTRPASPACRRCRSMSRSARATSRAKGSIVVMVPIQGGTDRIVAALDKGEIDVGKNATPYLIQAVLKGSDAVAVMSQTTNPIYSLIVRPEIKSFADLKGKTFGLSTPGDTITLSAVRLLGAKGTQTRRLQRQGRGRHAGALRLPQIRRMRCGADGPAGGSRRPSSSVSRASPSPTRPAPTSSSTSTWRGAPGASQNKDTLVRFVRAMASAYAFMNDPKNRDEITTSIKETGKISDEVARQIFAPYLDPDQERVAATRRIDLAAFNRVLALMSEVGAIPSPPPPAEKFVDLQYLKAAGIQ